jgi:septum formation protein
MRKIILASGSPRRREILESAGIKFVVEVSNFEEDMEQSIAPEELVKQLALGKAAAVATNHKNAIVIAADTVVAIGRKIWSKPETKPRAKMMLRALSGKSHDIWTGFCIIDTKSGKKIVRAEKTKLYFRKLSNREIDAYLAKGESLDVAGGYAFQITGSILSEKIEGDYNNIIGLPLAAVLKELKRFRAI